MLEILQNFYDDIETHMLSVDACQLSYYHKLNQWLFPITEEDSRFHPLPLLFLSLFLSLYSAIFQCLVHPCNVYLSSSFPAFYSPPEKVSWADLLREGGTRRTCIVGYLNILCCSSSTKQPQISK